jgi:hypothetical protein
MQSRREFLQYGAAVAACAAAPTATLARSAERLPLRVIVDRSIPASVQFAAHAALRAARVQWIDGDVGAAWMNDIEPQWRQHRAAIAGFTRAGALFCLELFARDYGLCSAYRAAHVARAAGGYAHAVSGHDARRSAIALEHAATAWPQVAAALATMFTAPARPLELLEIAAHDAPAAEPLYSWVITARAPQIT